MREALRDLIADMDYKNNKNAKHREAKLVSVIAPAFNEEENLHELYERICEVMRNGNHNFELLIVENGSTDDSLTLLKGMHRKDPRVNYLSFTRNFGHQGGLLAGLEHCRGDVVISMDADLQHPPELIPEMLRLWEKGYDVVYTKKRPSKTQSILRKWVNDVFYYWMKALSGIEMIGQSDYRLLDRQVLDVLCGLPERNKFLRGLTPWLGFPQTEILYDLAPRKAGTSKFPFLHLLRLAVDGIFSFSIIPLRAFVFLGLLISFGSFSYGVYILILKIASVMGVGHYFVPSGWTTIILVMLFLGGVHLIGIGMLGEYLGRVYDEVKGRPVYVIKEGSVKVRHDESYSLTERR